MLARAPVCPGPPSSRSRSWRPLLQDRLGWQPHRRAGEAPEPLLLARPWEGRVSSPPLCPDLAQHLRTGSEVPALARARRLPSVYPKPWGSEPAQSRVGSGVLIGSDIRTRLPELAKASVSNDSLGPHPLKRPFLLGLSGGGGYKGAAGAPTKRGGRAPLAACVEAKRTIQDSALTWFRWLFG